MGANSGREFSSEWRANMGIGAHAAWERRRKEGRMPQHTTSCVKCGKATDRERLCYICWAAAHPEKISLWRNRARERHLLDTYRLTLEDYDRMLASQNGGCAICGITHNGRSKDGKYSLPFAVDHDHATGENRGLLCTSCNFLVGFLEANVERYERAKQYLEGYCRAAVAVA
jgi:hypothetical protein